MATKKALGKGKEKPSGASSPVEKEGWRASKCSDFHLLGLVEEKLLQPCEVVYWCKALGDASPRKGPQETIIFQSYILHGLGIPTSILPRPFASLGDSSASLDPKLYPLHFNFCSSLRSLYWDWTAFQSISTSFPSETPTERNHHRCSWGSGFVVVLGCRIEIYPI